MRLGVYPNLQGAGPKKNLFYSTNSGSAFINSERVLVNLLRNAAGCAPNLLTQWAMLCLALTRLLFFTPFKKMR